MGSFWARTSLSAKCNQLRHCRWVGKWSWTTFRLSVEENWKLKKGRQKAVKFSFLLVSKTVQIWRFHACLILIMTQSIPSCSFGHSLWDFYPLYSLIFSKFTIYFYFSANVPEGKEVQTSFKLTPYRAGLCRVSATFRADMLSGVRGTSGVQVME